MPLECARVCGDAPPPSVARLRGEHAATPRTVRERRYSLEPLRVPLVPVEELDRLVPPSELDQCLDLVDDETNGAGFGDSLAKDRLDCGLETRRCLRGVPERKLEMTECGCTEQPTLAARTGD